MNTSAIFDALAIGIRLQNQFSNFSLSEVNLFAYLACLLSLYKQNPVSEWGYKFAATPFGSPYCEEIRDAIEILISAGIIIQEGNYYQVTDLGREKYTALSKLKQNFNREEFIEGACSSTLSLPLNIVKTALMRETDLNLSRQLQQTKFLLENGPRLEGLYNDFSILSQALGIEVKDMMIPAVVWLNYLLSIKQKD